METDKRRKQLLMYFLLLGVVTSLYMFYCLITYHIAAVAENGHIRYIRDFPYLHITRPLNFILLAITPFLSTLKHTKLLALLMMASLIGAYIFYKEYLISVWCFFAAILSLLIILVVKANNPASSTAA